jgi:hypothetical protein
LHPEVGSDRGGRLRTNYPADPPLFAARALTKVSVMRSKIAARSSVLTSLLCARGRGVRNRCLMMSKELGYWKECRVEQNALLRGSHLAYKDRRGSDPEALAGASAKCAQRSG